MTYIVYNENSSYWDVGEPLDDVPRNIANIAELGEQATSKVCRVHKHFTGGKHLALILAGPEMLTLLNDLVADAELAVSPGARQYKYDRIKQVIAKAAGR